MSTIREPPTHRGYTYDYVSVPPKGEPVREGRFNGVVYPFRVSGLPLQEEIGSGEVTVRRMSDGSLEYKTKLGFFLATIEKDGPFFHVNGVYIDGNTRGAMYPKSFDLSCKLADMLSPCPF